MCDVRATVVGEKVFAAAIRNDKLAKNSRVRDWRIGHYQGEMRIEAYTDFPENVARMCVAHTKALRLYYGAIDLVLDKKGEFTVYALQ